MVFTFLYIILAILALSFLIFIHELGHYIMARRVGMRVETFSIGFGRPVYAWERDGVKWQIGWLLFGGYVKIAGMDTENEPDPYRVPDGFFGKRPLDRIKVAVMGPLVNIVFAFFVFFLLWMAGGREKNFMEFTHIIGWVDPKSELYADGVRPGDEIVSFDGREYQSVTDLIYAPMTASSEMDVKGMKVNYATLDKTPFNYKVKPYPRPNTFQKGIQTSGIMLPANYIIYEKLSGGKENPLLEGSPLEGSGIKYGDRIIWADGDLLFSGDQLDHILNDGRVLLTIKRGNETLQFRVPRVQVQELKLEPHFKDELNDWQFEAELNGVKIQNLYVIPYNLNNEGMVESEAKFIDMDNQLEAFPKHPASANEMPLQKDDKIIAVSGIPIEHSYQLLYQLQKNMVNLIVERETSLLKPVFWTKADAQFDEQVDWKDLQKITQSIGTKAPLASSGKLFLLKPVTPKPRSEFIQSPEKQAQFAAEVKEQKKEIAAIEDPEKRAQATQMLEHQEKRLLLGFVPQDRKVGYNPTPTDLFANVFTQIWRTLSALFTGSLNPKWLSGPVGIVQVVYDSWLISIKDALFWIGAISLNLGVLNLLPIPVLDGGTILLCFFEMVTGKRLHPKTLEKLIIPFAVLLIGLFIFFTYNDLSRLLGGYLHW